jgi:hypothetical protein
MARSATTKLYSRPALPWKASRDATRVTTNYAVAQLFQTNGPNPEEKARGDMKSLASRVYPGNPG